MSKVLVALPTVHEHLHAALERLRTAGCEIVFNPHGRTFLEDELAAALPGVVATIAGTEPYTGRVFAAAPQLKVVARSGVGYDAIDVAAATRHRVAIAMGFGANHNAVADFAFSLMAALASKLVPYHALVAERRWQRSAHLPLWRATTGIVGLGRIGQALARRCRGFEMRVLAYDVLPDAGFAQQHGVELVDLATLFAEADFVSVHAPHTPETDKIVSRERIALMKPTAFLVNTARGGLVDEAALADALRDGKIAGAGLDVFEVEPLPPDSPLRDLPNVVMTPHCAGSSIDAIAAMADRCVDNALALLQDRNPGAGYVLNPEVIGRK
jgi:D-3-phosphoglycerate dehydrogenase / 2-oxoglutarate reductase